MKGGPRAVGACCQRGVEAGHSNGLGGRGLGGGADDRPRVAALRRVASTGALQRYRDASNGVGWARPGGDVGSRRRDDCAARWAVWAGERKEGQAQGRGPGRARSSLTCMQGHPANWAVASANVAHPSATRSLLARPGGCKSRHTKQGGRHSAGLRGRAPVLDSKQH